MLYNVNNKRSMEREELIKLIMERIYTRRIYAGILADDILRLFSVRRSALRLPKDQKLVDKIVYELNDYHNMKTQADPNEEGYAIGIIEEVLKHYA